MAREKNDSQDDRALRDALAALLEVHEARTPEELAEAAHRASSKLSGASGGALASALSQHVALVEARLRNNLATGLAMPFAGFARSLFDARKIETELRRELSRAERYRREASIVVIEATNLRLLSERFGDVLVTKRLEHLGATLASGARDIDVIGSYKQSGFTMILSEASNEGAANAASRLLSIAEEAQIDEQDVPGLELHLAVGWATFPEDGLTTGALFAAAAQRMYDLESRVA